MKLSMSARSSILALVALSAFVLVACQEEAEPVTIIKEVPVEVIKEVEVEKEVIKEVEVEKEVIKEVEVEVEKEVIKEVEVEKVVEKIVEVEEDRRTHSSEPEVSAGPPIYQMGIFEEPISRNFWNYYGGPAGSVWTQYVLDGHSGALYGYFGPAVRLGAGACSGLPY